MAVPSLSSPSVPAELRARAARWDALKRWERRELGQALRRLGLSYREIGAVIPVSKGTLSGWCRDVELTARQRERLAAKRPKAIAMQENGRLRRREALGRHQRLREAALADVPALADDPGWVAGLVAYWSEGAKRDGSVKFSNSDPALVVLFIAWAKSYLDVSHDRFTMALHLHDGQNEAERKAYWSSVTGIAPDAFRKTYIKREGTGHRKNILYNGTASVRIRRSGALLDRILGWMDGYAQGLTKQRAGRV